MIIGHRGCKNILENTLESILYSISLGVDGIEFDIYSCKTGEIVVNHDENLNRFALKNSFYLNNIFQKNIKELTWDEISKVDLIDKNKKIYKIPKLKHVLKNPQVYASKILINIEIKDLISHKKLEKLLTKLVLKGLYNIDRFLITSFEEKYLYHFQNFKVGKIYSEYPYDLFQNNFSHIILEDRLLTPDLVSKIKNLNLKLFVYTVNKKKDFLILEKIVDGIITDYPKKFLKLIK